MSGDYDLKNIMTWDKIDLQDTCNKLFWLHNIKKLKDAGMPLPFSETEQAMELMANYDHLMCQIATVGIFPDVNEENCYQMIKTLYGYPRDPVFIEVLMNPDKYLDKIKKSSEQDAGELDQ